MRIKFILNCLLRDSRGATAIEYGLIVGLIAIGTIGGMQAFGNESGSMWGRVQTAIAAVM